MWKLTSFVLGLLVLVFVNFCNCQDEPPGKDGQPDPDHGRPGPDCENHEGKCGPPGSAHGDEDGDDIDEDDDDSDGLTYWPIIVGVILGVLLIAAIISIVLIKRKRSRMMVHSNGGGKEPIAQGTAKTEATTASAPADSEKKHDGILPPAYSGPMQSIEVSMSPPPYMVHVPPYLPPVQDVYWNKDNVDGGPSSTAWI
jgi:hypothetical protein